MNLSIVYPHHEESNLSAKFGEGTHQGMRQRHVPRVSAHSGHEGDRQCKVSVVVNFFEVLIARSPS
jgi:hypothetical protein